MVQGVGVLVHASPSPGATNTKKERKHQHHCQQERRNNVVNANRARRLTGSQGGRERGINANADLFCFGFVHKEVYLTVVTLMYKFSMIS